MADRFDAVIVGSGMAGSLLAARLAEAGKRVLILEAGPARTLQSLTSSQLWSRRLKWGGAPVIETGKHPVGHNFNVGWGTGGSAMHHYAVWPRLHEDDFRLQSRFGRGRDWPFAYDELRPWYDAVQTEVGVSGDHEQEIWRPAGVAYDQSPVPVFRHGQVIANGFAKLGMKTAPLPLAIRTAPAGERKACIWDGWCDSGCPIGALANPLVTWLPRALRAGATLATDATVTAVHAKTGGRASGVSYVNALGVTRRVDAALVVVAASTIQNSRLLLASGLGNAHDQLGRRVMIHLACPVFGVWDEDTQPHMGATGGQLLNQDGYAKQRENGPFGSYQWMIAQAMKPNDLLGIGGSRVDLHGRALDDFMRRAARGFAMMTGVVEDLPLDGNRVTLGSQRDAHGVPLVSVEHTSGDESVALWEHARDSGIGILRAGGAEEAWAGSIGPMHIMGGTAMGSDAQASVTNGFGQLHDVPNVLVAGASLFPSSGGVNPTFTLTALAARSAAHLLEHWSDIVA